MPRVNGKRKDNSLSQDNEVSRGVHTPKWSFRFKHLYSSFLSVQDKICAPTPSTAA